jgi:hypothetical protein
MIDGKGEFPCEAIIPFAVPPDSLHDPASLSSEFRLKCEIRKDPAFPGLLGAIDEEAQIFAAEQPVTGERIDLLEERTGGGAQRHLLI